MKKHVESQAHQRAVCNAAKAEEEEAVREIRVQKLNSVTLAGVEARRFESPLSGALSMKHLRTPQMLTSNDETLREREMWKKFEMGGHNVEHSDLFNEDDLDEDEVIDAALKYFQAISLGIVGPADPHSSYDDGDETITNVMQKIVTPPP